MLKTILTRFLLLLFSFGIAGVGTAFTQNTCSLKLDVSTPTNHTPIKAARATAQSGKRIFRSTSEDGMPWFESLPSGKYTISVTKPGYKKTRLDQWVLNCEEVAADRSIFVYLWKGNSGQVAKMTNVLGMEARPIGESFSSSVEEPSRPAIPPSSTPPTVIPKVVSKGVMNGGAIVLPKPSYPEAAKVAGASGSVHIQVTVDEEGNVISAVPVSGHPLLRQACVDAARGAKFKPTLLSGVPVKVMGTLVYNFEI